MVCSKCGEPQAEFFTTAGSPVCRVCYYAEQTAIQDARALESVAAEMPKGVRAAQNAKPSKPGRVLKIGVALTGFGLVTTLALWFVLEDVRLEALAVLGFGLLTTVQGYKTRHWQ